MRWAASWCTGAEYSIEVEVSLMSVMGVVTKERRDIRLTSRAFFCTNSD